eukprot:GHUV01036535.1.p1 GENE.GHUV01036535.1~~GHUV01036535.1.p1  ORF type:complete len:508 (+),score=89.61 GHUV01036535.1:521-2044(+)
MGVNVLMVAEKPSLALSIAQFLSHNQLHSRRGALEVHEFSGSFLGQQAHFKMTSVIGHVYNLDFPAAYNSWDRVDPLELFDAQTVKGEANPKAHVCRHLQQEARGCDYLVLWLDCDREGENICFEVMDNTMQYMHRLPPGQQQVFRARFSAISAPEVLAAMRNLVSPNKAEALAVDARQELDLKVGVAFTRFQTRFFQGRYGNLDAAVVSYGPCQTPTLGFCVERHQAIVAFQPEPFWVVKPLLTKFTDHMALEWARSRVFDSDVGAVLASSVREAGALRVSSVTTKEDRKGRPHGLNTVELLKVASSALNIGPAQAMAVAERLYTSGYLSYPRTESSAYPPNFDIQGTLSSQVRHPIWGEYAGSLLQQGVSRPKGGVDVGDHPPITPVRAATAEELGGGDAWLIYEFVARHFLASISGDCVLQKTKAVMVAGGETFTATGSVVLRPGFTAIMPWKASQAAPLPPLKEGEVLQIKSVELTPGKTSVSRFDVDDESCGSLLEQRCRIY